MAMSDHKGAQSALEQAINAQRAKLISAHAVQQCLHEALLYADGQNAVMYSETARVVATLMENVLEQLDPVNLRSGTRTPEHAGPIE